MLPREERECRDSKRDRGPGPSAASAVNPGQVGGQTGTRLVECNAARAAIEVLAGYSRAATTTAEIRIQNACPVNPVGTGYSMRFAALKQGVLGPGANERGAKTGTCGPDRTFSRPIASQHIELGMRGAGLRLHRAIDCRRID